MWLVKDSDGNTVKFFYSKSEAEAYVSRNPNWGPEPLTVSWVEMP